MASIHDPQVLSQVLSAVYDAAADPVQWPRVLKSIAEHFDAQSAAVVRHDFSEEEAHWLSHSFGISDEVAQAYALHYGARDIWAEKARQRFSDNLRVGVSEELISWDQLQKTEYYNEFLLPAGSEHGLFGVISGEPSRAANISLYRCHAAGIFTSDEIEAVQLLLPHFKRAFSLQMQFTRLRKRNKVLLNAITASPQAIAIVGENGKLLFANPRAEQFFRMQDGVTIRGGNMCATSANDQLRLGEVIQHLTMVRTSAATLTVSRHGKPGLQLELARLHPDLANKTHLPQTTIAIFMHDPSSNAALSSTASFLESCGLTRAERRVALLLADGLSRKETADRLGVTENTVKTQSSVVYSKCNVRRQAELARKLR